MGGAFTPTTPQAPITQEEAEKRTEAFKKKTGVLGGVFQTTLKDVKPEELFPILPATPTSDAEKDRIRQQAIIRRLQAAAFTGTGRAATIATSPRGVTGVTSITRQRLTGI